MNRTMILQSLPTLDVPPHQDGSAGVHGADVELGAPRIVVGIEDPALRRRITFVLRADGYDVLPLRRRAALLRHLRAAEPCAEKNRPPDLVIFDEDGPASIAPLVDAIRALLVPCILLARSPEDADRAALPSPGMEAIFEHPFDIDDLRTAVLNLVPQGASW